MTAFPRAAGRLAWAAALVLVAGCAADDQRNLLTREDAVSVSWPESGISGLSAIHVYPGGTRFVALSDRNLLVEGLLLRQDGRLTGIEVTGSRPMVERDGSPLPPNLSDSEGLAVAPDGSAWVSFEIFARVDRVDLETGQRRWMPRPPGSTGLAGNAGYEALAIAPDGSLWTLPERTGYHSRPFPVMRFDGETWINVFDLGRVAQFVPVGADFGPDGRLYILERDFTGVGFRSRVRKVLPNGTQEELVFHTRTGAFGNLEGISAWEDDDGRLRLTMIADDNEVAIQRSQIVEVVLGD